MKPYDVWVTYLRLKLHFQSQVGYFDYDGALKTLSLDAYQKRKDRQLFERISKKYGDDSKRFLLSTFVALKTNPSDLYIHEILDDPHYDEQWVRFQKVEASLSRALRMDLTTCLRKTSDGSLKTAMRPDNDIPMLLRRTATYDLNIESYVMINKVIPINETYRKTFNIDPRVQKICTTASSYAPFVQVDTDVVKRIIKEVSESEKKPSTTAPLKRTGLLCPHSN